MTTLKLKQLTCSTKGCRRTAAWTWRENDSETLCCGVCFFNALQLLLESRDGEVEWVTPRTEERGAHRGSELLGMLTVLK